MANEQAARKRDRHKEKHAKKRMDIGMCKTGRDEDGQN